VILETDIVSTYYKFKYRRHRPYNEDSTLHPCIPIPSDNVAYPSAHAARGLALAEIFSQIFPEKKEQIMKQGYQIGTNRVLGGVHHPSDIVAGQKIAEEVVAHLRSKYSYNPTDDDQE